MEQKTSDALAKPPFFQKLRNFDKTDKYRFLFLAFIPLLATGVSAYRFYLEEPLFFVGLANLASSGVVFVDILRDKLADRPATWPRWFISAVFIAAAVGSVFIHVTSKDMYTLTFVLALVFLFVTLLPRLLSCLNRGLDLIPRLGPTVARILSAPNLYSLIILCSVYPMLKFFRLDLETIIEIPPSEQTLAFGGTVIVALSAQTLAFVGIVIVILSALLFRKLLWETTDHGLLPCLLPHLSVLTWISAIIICYPLENLLSLNDYVFFLTVGTSSIFAPLSLAWWGFMRLRRRLVEPLTDRRPDLADSIQSNFERYVDVHGHAKHLVRSITRSDAGVFGVTGVRGAGKSTLSRFLLHKLKGQFFTLEMTAPVRHDTDMAFLVSLCRGVCRAVLDDLTRSLQGNKGGAITELARQIRNILLGIGILVAVGALITTQTSQLTGRQILPEKKDPLLGDSYYFPRLLVEEERIAIDSLLAQMDAALTGFSDANTEHNQNTHYMLVPNPELSTFWLLRQTQYSNPKRDLISYKDSFDHTKIEPALFFRNFREVGEQFKREDFHLVKGDLQRMPAEGRKSTKTLAALEDFYNSSKEYSKTSWDEWKKAAKAATKTFFEYGKLTIINQPTINAPYKHLSHELHTLLLSKADTKGGNQSKHSPDDRSEKVLTTNELDLVSGLILKAFNNVDPKLSFNLEQLNVFREVLQIYRHLLDGNIITRSQDVDKQIKAVDTRMAKGFSLENMPFWTAVATIVFLLFSQPIWSTVSRLARAAVNYKYLVLYREARDFMDELTYHDSREISGGFVFKGLSFGKKRTLKARDLTLPGLTARYLAFVQLIRRHYNGKMVIVIDELDKIHDPEQVKALLTEIKGALFAEGVFYLISISEDAARSFHHRLSSSRDIFESTFDDIIEIRQMNVEAAEQMLAKRDEKVDKENRISATALPVIALFGGGIPREIIRNRKPVVNVGKPSEATPVTTAEILLRQAFAEWLDHIRESNLSGKETIRLRDCVTLAAQALEGSQESGEENGQIWNYLKNGLDIIDPENLRSANETEYQLIIHDLQACLRLMLLTHLYELILLGQNSWLENADRFLECYGTLTDKPALAEKLLMELHSC